MELRWTHIIHLYHVFLENDGKENCAQLMEEEFNKMFGIKFMNDEHDCNVVSMNSMNIQNTNDDCTIHDKMFLTSMSIFVECTKFVKTCLIGMIDFVRSISMIEPIFLLKVIDEFATKLCSLCPITCEICNKVGHLNFQCKPFHDRIMAKYCND